MASESSPILLTRIEAAAYCRVSPRAFDQHVRQEVPTVRVGKRVLFRREDLDAWIAVRAAADVERPVLPRPSSSSSAPVVALFPPRPRAAHVFTLDELIARGSRARRGAP